MSSLSQFTSNGKYLMLAFDHRESFKKLMRPDSPDTLTNEEVIELKREIISSVESEFSSLLIDPTFGLEAYKKVIQETGRTKPFLLPVEKTGYEDKKGERITVLESTLDQLKENGASGVKLLLYFNPYLTTHEDQLQTAKTVIDECKQKDYPIFLEIVTYEPDHEISMEERERLVLDSIKLFLQKNVVPDVFKLEYPGTALGCQTITAILDTIPWIILTRGDSFEHFDTQLKEASIRGCQGFLAGRALWQEVCAMQGVDKEKFLKEILPQRFKDISEIMIH